MSPDSPKGRTLARRRRTVTLWAAATVLCGLGWIATRNELFLVAAFLYGAIAVLLARRLLTHFGSGEGDSERDL